MGHRSEFTFGFVGRKYGERVVEKITSMCSQYVGFFLSSGTSYDVFHLGSKKGK